MVHLVHFEIYGITVVFDTVMKDRVATKKEEPVFFVQCFETVLFHALVEVIETSILDGYSDEGRVDLLIES